MAHIEKHNSGSFCWIELGTSDQNAAKSFYGSLLGWSATDVPMGPTELYTLFKVDGRDAAAGYTIRPEQKAQGVTPHWALYVCVENADQAARRVTELGGKVLAAPFDVSNFGRMAVLQDPTGATFSVWQPITSQGIAISGVDGTFCWADLRTPDPTKASEFYSSLFRWKIAAGEDNSGYLHIKNGEEFIGGIPPSQYGGDPNTPPYWMLYFAVADCASLTEKAKQLGAKVHMGPSAIENVGNMSILADPQGASFALFQPQRRA